MSPNVDASVRKSRSRRPRLAPDAQAAQILSTAERLFLAHGYGGTSVDMLVADSGGSLRDIYRLFGDKRGLFQRVVTDLAAEAELAMRAGDHETRLEGALADIARAFLRFLLSERALNLHRLMVADGARLGGVERDFIRHGPVAAYKVVEERLRSHLTEADCPPDVLAAAARTFIDGVSADFQLRSLMGERIGTDEREARIAIAVRLFLSGLEDFRTILAG